MLKIKVYLSVFLLTAAFLAVVVWRFESIERQKTISFIEAQSQVVLAGLSQALKTEFKKWAFSQSFSTQTLQGLKAKAYFIAHQDVDKKFVFDRTESFIGDENLATQMKYFETRFAKIVATGKKLQPEDDFIFEPAKLKKKEDGAGPQKLVSLVFRSGEQLVGLLLDAQVFQVHLDMFKSADGQMTILDDNQMILAQSEEDYFGTKAAGLEASSEKEFVLSNTIPQTNLSLVYKASYAKVFGQRNMSWLQFLLIGFGFLFVCLGVLSFLLSSKENREDQLSEQNASLRQDIERLKVEAAKVKQLEAKTSGPVPVAAQEKIDQAKNTISSLALEMNPHLMALVGLVSRLQTPLSFQDVTAVAQNLNTEIQKARSLIMKIFEYTGVASSEKTIASFELPLQEALRNLKPLLDKNEVQVSKNIQTKATVKMTVKHVVRALSEIIENSVDAMERMPNKKISITVDENADSVRLIVKDNGEGLAQGVQEKIFEPFFTTRGFKNKKGLGLSAVMGILKEHGAECAVHSEVGKGCEFVMVFKKEVEAKVETKPETTLEAPKSLGAEQPVLEMDSFQNTGIIRHGSEVALPAAPKKLDVPSLTPIQKATQETDQLHDEIVTLALQKAKAEKNQMREEAKTESVSVLVPTTENKSADPDLEELLSVPDADSSIVAKPVVAHHIGRPQFKKKRTESILSEFAAPKIPQTSLPKEAE